MTGFLYSKMKAMKFRKHLRPTRLSRVVSRGMLAALACAFATNVGAWGTQGHQVIASIAQTQLTSSARKEVDRLLALEPGETLISISTWADEHRNPATGQWHYVNFPRDTCSYNEMRDCPEGKCVVGAIEKQASILEFDVSDEKRLTALKYLVHFVGDVHQPLHAGYLDDKGGNTYQLRAFMRGSNLHALWDTGLIRNLEVDSDALAKRLLMSASATPGKDLRMSVAAEESCRIVGMPGFYPDRKVGQDYIEKFTPVMERRLATAGAWLAAILNREFKVN